MKEPSEIILSDPAEMVIQLQYAQNVLPHVNLCRGIVVWQCRAYSVMFTTDPPRVVGLRMDGIHIDDRVEHNRELYDLVHNAFCQILAEARDLEDEVRGGDVNG